MSIIDVLVSKSPALKQTIYKIAYECLSRLDREADMIFMNFGYADLDPNTEEISLREADQKNRYCIQLYHRVAGAIELKDLDVLEVSCGRGGGASYIRRYLKPRSIVGIDISEKAIEFCNRYYSVEGLSFCRGDAQSLSLEDNTFDVVVNVESSHCYRYMDRFLSEVRRVLRPGGWFLFADFRHINRIASLREHLRRSGLELLEEERITPNVVRALELDSERKLRLIRQKVPQVLHKRFQRFAGVEGTETYESFRAGKLEYLSFVLQKQK